LGAEFAIVSPQINVQSLGEVYSLYQIFYLFL